MAVNRANSLLMNQGMPSQHLAIHYEPRSDFINLSKLNALMLARKLEADEKKESQGTLTFKGWIWENLANLLAMAAKETRMGIEIESTVEKKLTMKIQMELLIMGITI